MAYGTRTVTLSSVGTATIVLDPTAKATTLVYTVTSGSCGVSQIDLSLDDPSQVGGATATWALLSTTAALQSSNAAATGYVFTVLSPIGAVRINSTAVGASQTITLKALQTVIA